MAAFTNRVAGAMRLNAASFEDVEHDASATGQAAFVVLAASIARGLGYYQYGGISFAAGGALIALAAWMAGASLLWILGTRVLPGRRTEADVGQLLRTVGFAQAPGIFAAVTVIPVIAPLAGLLVMIWTLMATIIAVRQALDYEDTLRAVIVCVLAVAVEAAVVAVLALFGLGLGLGVRTVY